MSAPGTCRCAPASGRPVRRSTPSLQWARVLRRPQKYPIQNLMVTARVNGQVLQHASTKLMIFSVARTIAFISSIMTLVPGDIIATGTPAGVGFTRKPPIFLHDGDVVEIEIEKIGTIVNRVVGPR